MIMFCGLMDIEKERLIPDIGGQKPGFMQLPCPKPLQHLRGKQDISNNHVHNIIILPSEVKIAAIPIINNAPPEDSYKPAQILISMR